MLEVFEDVQKGHCHRQASREMKERKDSIDEAEQLSSVGAHGEVVDLSQMPGGEVVDTKGNITLKDVAIITPCGDVVVSSLSFEVISNSGFLFCLFVCLFCNAFSTDDACRIGQKPCLLKLHVPSTYM